MINFLLADPNHIRLAVARDRMAEAALLSALRSRALAENEERAAQELQAEHERFLKRELLQADLVAAFGVGTMSLLHLTVVDGRDEDEHDAAALLTYRFPYALRINRAERLWVLALLDESGDQATYFTANKQHPLRLSWPLSRADAANELWCAIADLAARHVDV
jgi:hypothetical protein